jgi:hypothetical protein
MSLKIRRVAWEVADQPSKIALMCRRASMPIGTQQEAPLLDLAQNARTIPFMDGV